MAKITIDGIEVEVEDGTTILNAARKIGGSVVPPAMCYYTPLKGSGGKCRVCLVKVTAGSAKDPRPMPKLVASCVTPVQDGMVVENTLSPQVMEARKGIVEMLLINHPLDCPVCDQAGECYLQDYSYRYGRSESRFEETKIKQPKKDIGPHVLLYSDRCIMCSRCVRFTREVTGTGELGVMGRGNKEEIDIFPGRPLDNPLSGNVVDICPVGALLDKSFLFEQRVWYLESAPSIDPITAGGDNIWIDHNEGRIWRLKPRTNMDVNKWWISDEIRHGWGFAHDENRLRTPRVKRHGGQEEEADWQAAYSRAVEGLRGKKVALLASPMISCEDAWQLARATRQIDSGAMLAVGPVPRQGEDQSFKGGYTIYAEKAPNARGVRRALDTFGGTVGDYKDLIAKLPGVDAVIITGNYPSAWIPDDLLKAIGGKFTVLIDTLPNRLTDKADVVLPAAVWAEKSGTFENVNNKLQAFVQAIAPIEFARPEGQIGIDLLVAAGGAKPSRFDAEATRQQMGGVFADVKVPSHKDTREPDMQFVEF